eukprot:CAMPEP_0114585586 /NCGR_PEP_ID=MMETSP0125-20121206/9077_1 /TAXON_ID=485358 ORGANISM="Aristerostoma sp., Strain ATCC 50986" /NCGR_SAMPLE_ID=MMETSP0125 /ASSEMBLY_ACC=CAM_ASM_000245 /LENGTH=142 /DNA_ID=CAMNT_0001780707 /DNA_START=812 /DNA_END=1240 /DNA_ORIENTATION=+
MKCAEFHQKGLKGLSFMDFIEYFSENEIDIKKSDSHDRTLLHLASLYDDISVIRYLVSFAPELIDKKDKDENTPLCTALSRDRFYGARYLLKHGANPTIGGGFNGSALHIAVKKMSYTIVNDILKLGENPNKIDSEGNTPLH